MRSSCFFSRNSHPINDQTKFDGNSYAYTYYTTHASIFSYFYYYYYYYYWTPFAIHRRSSKIKLLRCRLCRYLFIKWLNAYYSPCCFACCCFFGAQQDALASIWRAFFFALSQMNGLKKNFPRWVCSIMCVSPTKFLCSVQKRMVQWINVLSN